MNIRKMMNAGIICAIIIFLVLPGKKVFSWPWTKGNLTGSVYDENDSTNMLERVRIFMVEEEISTFTDIYGGFLIKDIRAGIHTLTFEKQGFLKETAKVQIKKDQTLQLQPVGLKRAKGIYSLDRWSELAAAHVVKELKQSGLKKFRIAISFYLKSGSSTCELKDLTLKFTNKLNSLLSK
ncbi:MAG: carboxypeptidase-like regulatory domain-containing protein [Desulfobacterales bacterium]|nr:carboxypeptidase-like regulatory domain-containing protein [Desulfobacterales bacterium]